MDVSQIPVGQSVVINDDENIKSTFTRVTEGEGVFEQFAPDDGRRVLKTTVSIPDGSTTVEHVDHSFWTVLLDGKPLPPGASARGSIQSDPQDSNDQDFEHRHLERGITPLWPPMSRGTTIFSRRRMGFSV